MPLHDIFQKIKSDDGVRKDFVDTLVNFARRHGVEDADHKDFHFDTSAKPALMNDGGSSVSIYRDGPRTSRWVDSG